MIRRTLAVAFAAAVVMTASDASAQTIGFKLGASFANWNIEDAGEDAEGETLTSFMGGGFIRFGMGRFGIQPELLVVTRGTQFEDEDLDATLKLKVDYVEVPVLLVLPLSMGTGISPYVFGGPSFAFEIGCTSTIEFGNEEDSGDCDEEGSELQRKSTDIGATAGAGLEFPLGPGNLLIEGRYNWGLSNLSDEPNVDVKSRTGAILAGYSIWLGRR